MTRASTKGHLDVVKYLSKLAYEYTKDFAMFRVAKNGHLDVVKYLVEEQGVDNHVDGDYALRGAAGNGHQDVVDYLRSLP